MLHGLRQERDHIVLSGTYEDSMGLGKQSRRGVKAQELQLTPTTATLQGESPS